jgi:hypothetical protein
MTGIRQGYGDRGYPVYAGIAADGRVVSVVIDLVVLRGAGSTGSRWSPGHSGAVACGGVDRPEEPAWDPAD